MKMKRLIAVLCASMSIGLMPLASCSFFNTDQALQIKSVTHDSDENGNVIVTITYTDEEATPTKFTIPAGISGKEGVGIASVDAVENEDKSPINQMMSTPLARQELAISGTADADSAPLGGSIYSVDTGDVRNLTAVEAQMLYQAAQQDVAEGRVISDILSDTGYSPLQVDITGNDWDCVLNLDNFTDDAHTLELVNRFLSGGDGESGE